MVLTRARIGSIKPLKATITTRYAHAQAAAQPDEQEAGPSNYRRSTASSSSTGSGSDHKGKGKAREQGYGQGQEEGYRFPAKGKMGGEPDPFEVMSIERSASQSEVKKQYYRLALLLHPDSSHPSSSPEHFAALHRAYTLLSNPAKRNSYIQTGYGWSPSSSDSSSSSSHSYEDRMRAEIRYRASGGASSWHGRGRPGYAHGGQGYRDSEGGRGAFGGFRGGDGRWEPYDTGEFSTPQGSGEERYMSNLQFLGLIAGISLALGWAQVQRFMSIKEQGSELLERQHLDASHALAEARKEAALFGKERRERIRRRVRESEVLREVEQLELERPEVKQIE